MHVGKVFSRSLVMKVELAVLSLMKHQRNSMALGLLWLLSGLYRMVHWLRDKAFAYGIFKIIKAPLPVISIGNITAGGTGKTPLTMLLLDMLQQKMHCAVLSSGYRKMSAKEGKIHPHHNQATEMGDEAVLIATKYPEVSVYSTRKYCAFARYFRDSDVLILDDGMQKKRIHRDIEIVCMRKDNLLGYGYFLPRGLLREHPRRLKDADYICVNDVENDADYEYVEEVIRRYSNAPIVGVAMRLNSIICYGQKQKMQSKPCRVGVFCAIAHPESFLDLIHKEGMESVDTLVFADHAPFDPDAVKQFAWQCQAQGAKALVCTEKDAIKMPQNFKCSLPIYIAEAKLKINYGIQYFDCLKTQISSWKSERFEKSI